MKCTNCGSRIKEGAKFCPHCGKAVPTSKTCIHCGASIKPESEFCAYCGTSQAENAPLSPITEREQNMEQEKIPKGVSEETCVKPWESETEKLQEGQQEDSSAEIGEEQMVEDNDELEKEYSSKKWLWATLWGLLFVGFIAGGIYFFGLSGRKNSELTEASTVEMTGDDSDGDAANEERLPTADEVEHNFNGEYSAELRRLEGLAWREPGFGEISYMGVPCSDCEVKSLKLKEINVTSPTTASATAIVKYGNEEYLETQTNSVKLILEDGHWVIDDYDGWHDALTQHFSQANETTDNDQAEEFSGMSKGFYVEVNYGYYFYIPRFLREGEQHGELAKDNSALYENNGYSLLISVDESDIEGQFWMYDKMRSRNGEYDVYEESMITKNKDYWKVDDNSGSILLIMQSKDNKKCGTMYFTYPDGGKAIVEEAIEKSIRKTRENDV